MTKTYAHFPEAEMNAVLAKFKRAGERAAERALDVGTEALVSEAQLEAPVKTGLLKERHFAEKLRPLLRLIGVNTAYALAVHETHATKKRWFVEAVKTNFKRIFEGALKKAIDQEARP